MATRCQRYPPCLVGLGFNGERRIQDTPDALVAIVGKKSKGESGKVGLAGAGLVITDGTGHGVFCVLGF